MRYFWTFISAMVLFSLLYRLKAALLWKLLEGPTLSSPEILVLVASRWLLAAWWLTFPVLFVVCLVVSRPIANLVKDSPKAALIATSLAVSLLVAGMVEYPSRSVYVQFEWEQLKGFKSISVESPPLGAVHGYLITTQAKPRIAAEFKKIGWNSARGKLDVHVSHFVYVSGFGANSQIDDPEVTPLMQAAEKNDSVTVQRLLSEHAGVNALDQRGRTALMYASMSCASTAAKMLLASGADPNIKDRAGRTALMWAARECQTEVMSLILTAGADANARHRPDKPALSDAPCPKSKVLEHSASPASARR